MLEPLGVVPPILVLNAERPLVVADVWFGVILESVRPHVSDCDFIQVATTVRSVELDSPVLREVFALWLDR